MFKITLITIGNKMPSWVDEAVYEFSKRLQDGLSFTLVEIPLTRRGKSADLSRIMDKEKAAIQAAIPHASRLIALDVTGVTFSSEQLAVKLEQLQQINSHLCFLIGGPEGLHQDLVNQSAERWSLSRLTLPHTIARICFIEALYRAWTIMNHHPYHK